RETLRVSRWDNRTTRARDCDPGPASCCLAAEALDGGLLLCARARRRPARARFGMRPSRRCAPLLASGPGLCAMRALERSRRLGAVRGEWYERTLRIAARVEGTPTGESGSGANWTADLARTLPSVSSLDAPGPQGSACEPAARPARR